MDDLDYFKKGQTIYDLLGKVFPFLNGNYSIQNLLEQSIKFSGETDYFTSVYKDVYSETVKVLRQIDNDLFKGATEEEGKELLAELYSMKAYDSTLPTFTTLKDYLNFTVSNENIINPKYEDLRRKILSYGIKHLSPEFLLEKKSQILSGIYFPKAREVIRRKNEALGIKGDTQDIKHAISIIKRVGDKNWLAGYDEMLEKIAHGGEEFKQRALEEVMITFKRARVVQKGLKDAAPEDKVANVEKTGFDIDSVFFRPKTTPQRDSAFQWTIEKYDVPKLILNETARYSEDGSADQKVIAVSYGKFKAGSFIGPNGKPSFESENLEVVGVSRIGEDGVKNYYILLPIETYNPLAKYENGKIERYEHYGFLDQDVYQNDTDGMPAQYRQFFASVFLSDAYLDRVIKSNYRYAGVVEGNIKPKIVADESSSVVIGSGDLEAARFAATHTSEDYYYSSLGTPNAFVEFYRYQNAIADSIMKKEREAQVAKNAKETVEDLGEK